MRREDLVKKVTTFRWKKWGNFRNYSGSKYQCFRRGNEYVWIGNRFIEKSTEPIAVDFVIDEKEAVDLVR